MKRVIKAAKEMTEEEKEAWLKTASAKDLLNQYDYLRTDITRNFSYNPDYEITRKEVLRRLGGHVQETSTSTESVPAESTLTDVIDNLIYQVWENNKGEGLSSADVVDEVIEHIDMLNNEDELDVYLPDDWRKQVENMVTSQYDKYEW